LGTLCDPADLIACEAILTMQGVAVHSAAPFSLSVGLCRLRLDVFVWMSWNRNNVGGNLLKSG
jgi:hypothetical protein